MCGLAGKTWINECHDPSLLEAMMGSMHHRGPDDNGIIVRSAGNRIFGLVSTRLSILDLTLAGHMPMANEGQEIWIVYNGEIYNHLSLRSQLITRPGIRFRSRSDTETLLLAYQEYGLSCLPRLNGMFAFAILDLRKRRLILARDRMGIKPLYYHWDGTNLTFASELKTLMKDTTISRDLSVEALDLYLSLGFVPSPYSLFDNVKKLEPGHYLIVEGTDLTVEPYWSPETPFIEPHQMHESDLVVQTRTIVSDAIRRQLMSDVPVGVLLSGGLDSSIVAAIANEQHSEPLHTFSIGFRTTKSELEEMYNWDRNYARQVADELGTIHHEVELSDETDLIGQLESRIRALDEPVWETSYLSISLLAELARDNGVKVLLTGDGSDEIFGGYPWYFGARRQEVYDRIPMLGTLVALLSRIVPGGELKSKLEDLAHKHRQPAHIKYLRDRKQIPVEARQSILSPCTDANIASEYLAGIFARVPNLPLSEQFGFADHMLWVREHFNQRVDRMTMMASVEARVPFQDDEVVAFAAGVPFFHKVSGGIPKSLLKQAFKDKVPSAIISRPKRPFATPSKSWLEGSLKQYAYRQFHQSSLRNITLLDAKAVQEFAYPLLGKGFSNDGPRFGFAPLCNLLSLVIWLRQNQQD